MPDQAPDLERLLKYDKYDIDEKQEEEGAQETTNASNAFLHETPSPWT